MSDETVEAAGWRLDVEGDALRAEHLDTGNEYVFGGDGSLTLPGDSGTEVAALQAALASGLAEERASGEAAVGDDGDRAASDDLADESAAGVKQQSAGCRVECDQQTDEVIIESPTKISLDAPEVEVSGEDRVNVSSSGSLNLSAAAVMNLRGAIINLN